jgi:predicted metalloprotease with PDZ domain
LAVVVFAALDAEIRSATDGVSSLDDLLRQLHRNQQPVDLTLLVNISKQLTNATSDVLDIDNLPGCSKFMPGDRDYE